MEGKLAEAIVAGPHAHRPLMGIFSISHASKSKARLPVFTAPVPSPPHSATQYLLAIDYSALLISCTIPTWVFIYLFIFPFPLLSSPYSPSLSSLSFSLVLCESPGGNAEWKLVSDSPITAVDSFHSHSLCHSAWFALSTDYFCVPNGTIFLI